jgi:hypothetical protein
MGQVFSVPAELPPETCETIASPPRHRLRRHVAGYSGFRTRVDPSVRRRILPLNLTVVLIDVAGGYGLLGTPVSDLAGRTVTLEDLLGRRASPNAWPRRQTGRPGATCWTNACWPGWRRSDPRTTR